MEKVVLLSALFGAGLVSGCIDNPDNPNGNGDSFPNDGRKCTWEVVEADTGAIVERWSYIYASRGHIISQSVDYGGTGETDFSIEYAYDQRNRLIREDIDEDGDGQVDRLIHHHYCEDGRRTISEETDGSANSIVRQYFYYDTRNRLSYRDDDYGANGRIEARTTWSYDGDDNAILVVQDHGRDGIPNQIIEQEFEFLGGVFRLVRRRGDWNADGNWDYEQRLFWNDEGLLLGREIDEGGDGLVNERWRYSYNSEGVRVSGDGDTNGDGHWDLRQVYNTDCTTFEHANSGMIALPTKLEHCPYQ